MPDLVFVHKGKRTLHRHYAKFVKKYGVRNGQIDKYDYLAAPAEFLVHSFRVITAHGQLSAEESNQMAEAVLDSLRNSLVYTGKTDK